MTDQSERFREVFDAEPASVVSVEGRGGVPCQVWSFVKGAHYAGNFGKQWARFRNVQIDSLNGTSISRQYMEDLLGFPVSQLAGKAVLEVGAGAGRFTEHFVRHAKSVVAVDLSEAIFVNVALGADNLVPAQANLLEMPPLKRKFDLVYCRGVLQHTPDPLRSIAELHRWVAPDGLVVYDVYPRGTLGRFGAKYVLRPIIQRLFTYETFVPWVERNAERILRLRWKVKPFLPGKTYKLLDFVLPIYDYRDRLPLTDAQLIEWGQLDTVDGFFAKYDNPFDCDEILQAVERMGARVVSFDRTMNFFRTAMPAGREPAIPADTSSRA